MARELRFTDPRERGFSLLEMMIALVIMGVITSQMFVVLSTQKRAYTGGSRDNDLQESARLISDLLSFDARNAGMMIPREAAIASFDGGNTGPDRICMSDTSFFQIPAAGVKSTFWDSVGDRVEGPQVTSLGIDQVTVNTLDVDGDGFANDWNPRAAAGQPQPQVGIIIARRDGRASYCGQVDSLIGATTFRLRTADVPTSVLLGSLVAVPAVVYELRDDTADGEEISTLFRNGVAVSTQVEDLQVEFGIDSTSPSTLPDGRLAEGTEFPIHNLAPNGLLPSVNRLPSTGAADPPDTALSRIRRVRLSVLSRSALEDETGNRLARHVRPAIANRRAGDDPDAFTRRTYTVSVLPRNLLKPGELSSDVP